MWPAYEECVHDYVRNWNHAFNFLLKLWCSICFFYFNPPCNCLFLQKALVSECFDNVSFQDVIVYFCGLYPEDSLSTHISDFSDKYWHCTVTCTQVLALSRSSSVVPLQNAAARGTARASLDSKRHRFLWAPADSGAHVNLSCRWNYLKKVFFAVATQIFVVGIRLPPQSFNDDSRRLHRRDWHKFEEENVLLWSTDQKPDSS